MSKNGFIHTKPRYSVNDLIYLTGVGRGRLYDELNSGRIKSYYLGKRRFVSPAALDDYIELCEKSNNEE